MHTKVNWFEIPSTDFRRAVRFYETLFDTKLKLEHDDSEPTKMALFQDASGESVGCVLHNKDYTPGAHGILIYLDASPSIDTILARIEPAGGTIRMHKLELPNDIGFIAHFSDSEGNLLALHSQS